MIHVSPGIGVFLVFGNIPSKPTVFIAAVCIVSTAWNLLWSLILLYFGLFNGLSLIIVALLPFIIGLLRQKGRLSLLNELRSGFTLRSETIVCLILGISFGILFLVTPKWNFLISPNMDAGNYETYSNYFWTSGSLYWNVNEYLERGVPWDWIQSRNTWTFDKDNGLAKPVYLYGFPVVLSMAKTLLGSPAVSWCTNALFSMISVALLAFIGFRITQNRFIGAGLALMVCFTPMFYYYSKQAMSEASALFGFLALVVGISEYVSDRRSSYLAMAFAGLFLMLQVKLDAYVIPVFVLFGLGMAALATSETSSITMRIRNLYFVLGGCTAFSAIIVCLLERTYYLGHVTIDVPLIPGQPFLFSFGLYLLVGFCLFPFVFYLYDRFLRARRYVQCGGFYLSVGLFSMLWIVFIAWNLGLRPVGQDVSNNHEPFNLIRLFTVSSPIALILLCAGIPLALIKSEGGWRAVVFIVAASLIFLVYNSTHRSSASVWWMRRYLSFLLPAMVLVMAYIWQLINNSQINRTKAIVGVSILLTGTLFVQFFQLVPFFKHEVNKDAPRLLSELENSIPDNALLVVLEGGSVTRGSMNTFRSLRSGPTLLNVPMNDLQNSFDLYTNHVGKSYLLASIKIKKISAKIDLEPIKEGYISKQWVNTLEALHNNPKTKKYSPYFLYNIKSIR